MSSTTEGTKVIPETVESTFNGEPMTISQLHLGEGERIPDGAHYVNRNTGGHCYMVPKATFDRVMLFRDEQTAQATVAKWTPEALRGAIKWANDRIREKNSKANAHVFFAMPVSRDKSGDGLSMYMTRLWVLLRAAQQELASRETDFFAAQDPAKPKAPTTPAKDPLSELPGAGANDDDLQL